MSTLLSWFYLLFFLAGVGAGTTSAALSVFYFLRKKIIHFICEKNLSFTFREFENQFTNFKEGDPAHWVLASVAILLPRGLTQKPTNSPTHLDLTLRYCRLLLISILLSCSQETTNWSQDNFQIQWAKALRKRKKMTRREAQLTSDCGNSRGRKPLYHQNIQMRKLQNRRTPWSAILADKDLVHRDQ